MLEKRKSKIHGFGIFTKSPIQKGKVFYIVPNDKISNKPTKRFARIRNGEYINDDMVLNWINHSCEENSELVIGDRPKLVAIKYIKIGEEITCDYNKTEIGGNKAVCKCGSTKCRGCFLRVIH